MDQSRKKRVKKVCVVNTFPVAIVMLRDEAGDADSPKVTYEPDERFTLTLNKTREKRVKFERGDPEFRSLNFYSAPKTKLVWAYHDDEHSPFENSDFAESQLVFIIVSQEIAEKHGDEVRDMMSSDWNESDGVLCVPMDPVVLNCDTGIENVGRAVAYRRFVIY